MKTTNCFTSACRYCNSYQPQGRRGGMCEQLGVPVQAQWKSCNFAKSPFDSPLEEIALLERIFISNSSNYDTLDLKNNSSDLEFSLNEQEVIAA